MGILNNKKKKPSTGNEAAEETKSGGLISGLKSLGQSKSGGSRLRDNERLSSVIDETETGWAIDNLEANKPFKLPRNLGYVILGLQTQDKDFGGLSMSTNRDKSKGSLVNLANSGGVNTIATADLLDADLLGLVIDDQSAEQFYEFDILRKARYVWTVVTTDPHTSELVSFWVPSRDPELMKTGQLLEQAMEIYNGELSIEDAVDVDLIDMMDQILAADPEDGGGVNGLDEAMGLIHSVIFSFVPDGKTPDDEYFHTALREDFPGVFGESPDDSIADAVVSETVSDGLEDSDELDGLDDEQVDALNAGDAAAVAADVVDDAPKGRHARDEDEDEDDVDEVPEFDDDEPDFGDDFVSSEQTTSGRHASDADVTAGKDQFDSVVGRGQVSTPQISDEDLGRLAGQIVNELQGRAGDVNTPGNVVAERINQASGTDDRVFNSDAVNDRIKRDYSSYGVSLTVDEAPLAKVLGYDLPILTLPEEIPATPWLRDQLEVIVSSFNDRLNQEWQNGVEQTRTEYFSLMDAEAQTIIDEVDPENVNGPFSAVMDSIRADDNAMKGKISDLVSERHRNIEARHKAQRDAHIEKKKVEAATQFDNSHTAQFKRELDIAAADVHAQQEEVIEAKRSELKERIEVEANNQFTVSTGIVIENLVPIVESRKNALYDIFNMMQNEIREYLDNHREEDIHKVNTDRDLLERDTRVEAALSEADSMIAAANSRNEKELALVREARERDRESFEAELQRNKENAASLTAAADARVAEVEARSVREIGDVNSIMENMKATHEAELEKVTASANVEIASVRNVLANNKRENKTMMFMFVMAIIIAVVASVVLTMIVTG